MTRSDRMMKVFKALLPSPFTIAVILSVITFLIALIWTDAPTDSDRPYALTLLTYWEQGLWEDGLMVFAMQMMLMLVLGHALALTKPVAWIINGALRACNNTANAAAIVTTLTIIVALFNWGLGLVFGAIFARKVGEHAIKNNISLNYPLIGAAGYVGLMVWHGGISGSSLAKIAEDGHIQNMMVGSMDQASIAALPLSIGYSETVFSPMNLIVSAVLLIALPAFMYWMGKRSKSGVPVLRKAVLPTPDSEENIHGAERLDHSLILGISVGLIVLGYSIWKAFNAFEESGKFIDPNFINLFLFGSCILLHGRFSSFLKAIEEAIGGAAGILIQFPLYFGIMGLMKYSGLVEVFSNFFINHSNATTYPIFTFISAGIVNIFVPSGGGQWAVQGPIIVQAATAMGIDLPKSIMAMAYGDQLTNMLQPFWALPLLGITGLKAKEILPYTVLMMMVGAVIFVAALLLF